jgi:hypothetical protein
MGVFFTQDKVDDKGYPVRDRASSGYIATFEPAAAFQRLVKAEGIRRGADHVRQLTVIGDGAAWIWNSGRLPLVPLTRPVRRLRRRRGRMQVRHRPAPQTGRHALDRQRRRLDHHPPQQRSQQPVGSRLQPGRNRLTFPAS